MENDGTQPVDKQILTGIGGRRGRRGRNLLEGKVTLVSGGHGGYRPQRPHRPPDSDQSAFSWSIMRFLFSAGFSMTELPATLIFWAEVQHPEAYNHMADILKDPAEVRRTLGAMFRRMSKDQSVPAIEPLPCEPDQAEPINPRSWADALTEAVANDPTSMEWLQPYIDRDAEGMAAVEEMDKGYRGQLTELDRRVTKICLDSQRS